MDNNSINTVSAGQPAEKVYFVSDTVQDRALFEDLALPNYDRMNKLFLIYLIFFTFFVIYSFSTSALTVGHCTIAVLIALLLLFCRIRTRKNTDIFYGQQKVRTGKDVLNTRVEFGERIKVLSGGETARTYEYAMIKKVFKTKKHYLLVMDYGVTIIADINITPCSSDVDFERFILNKCYDIKNRKFKKMKSGPKQTKLLLVFAVLLSVVTILLYMYTVTPTSRREDGKNYNGAESSYSADSND